MLLLTGETIMGDFLNKKEKIFLLKLARNTIKAKIFNTPLPQINKEEISGNLKQKTGCFVTLHKHGNLRGCIGYIEGREPLYQAVIDNAINAAFRDPRFSPLSKEEFDKIDIEITILTKPEELYYENTEELLKKLQPNIDGVIIQKGFFQATFLPQVWEQLPTKEEFLTHLCLKAGLPPDEWEKGKLRVFIYHAFYFDEKNTLNDK